MPQTPDLTPSIDAAPLIPMDGSSSGADLSGLLASGNGQGSGGGSGDGTGSGSGTPDVRYGRAEWINYPTLAEINPYWPVVARKARMSGHVVLGCELRRPGKPDRCWLLSEQPSGYGFGRAALRMSRIFRIRPVTRNGETFDLPVRVPVVFAAKSITTVRNVASPSPTPP